MNALNHASLAGESDETNKSAIPVDEPFGEKKGIPAGRPGRDEDIAQAVLSLACNQYAYGSVCFPCHCGEHATNLYCHRHSLSMEDIYSSIHEPMRFVLET